MAAGFSHHDDDDQRENPFDEIFKRLGFTPQMGDGNLDQQMDMLFTHLQRFFHADPNAPALDPKVVSTTAKRAMKRDARNTQIKVNDKDIHDLQIALELADSWLTPEITTMASTPIGVNSTWTREQWLNNSMPRWVRLTEPIVTHMAEALQNLSANNFADNEFSSDALPPELEKMAAQLRPLLRHIAGSMFAAQMGDALGSLATQVLSASDLGFPITDSRQPVLLAQNVVQFAENIPTDAREAKVYVALREVARQRLFSQVTWLEPQIIALVEHYASQIQIDPSALEQAFDQIQHVGPQEMAITIDESVFMPTRTPEQIDMLKRLEILLALVEGWVEDVVETAAKKWIPNASALSEAVRRRRAIGGPTEKAMQALFGFQMQPRSIRDAKNLWAALRVKQGIAQRDAIWQHPDSLPTAEDLSDPIGFVQGEHKDSATEAMDAEFRKFLEGNA